MREIMRAHNRIIPRSLAEPYTLLVVSLVLHPLN